MEPAYKHINCLIDSTEALPYCQEHEVYISDEEDEHEPSN